MVKRKKDHQALISLHALYCSSRLARLPNQSRNCSLIEFSEPFLEGFDKTFLNLTSELIVTRTIDLWV
jgi:hypothetical protein